MVSVNKSFLIQSFHKLLPTGISDVRASLSAQICCGLTENLPDNFIIQQQLSVTKWSEPKSEEDLKFCFTLLLKSADIFQPFLYSHYIYIYINIILQNHSKFFDYSIKLL